MQTLLWRLFEVVELSDLQLRINSCCIICCIFFLFLSCDKVFASPGPVGGKSVYGVSEEKEKSTGAFEVYASTSGELYHFHVLDDENNEKSTNNYTGRKNKMDYSFKPVYMAAFDASVSWDFLQFSGIYKTNQIITGGGSIEHDNDLLSRISDDNVSEILGLGIQLFDLKTSFRSVVFDFGEARVIDVETDSVTERQDLILSITEADISYQRPYRKSEFAGGMLKSRYFFGYRYMQYSLPRIVYTFEKDSQDSEDKEWIYKDETEPQEVSMNMHMAGYGVEAIMYEDGSNLQVSNILSFYYGIGKTELTLQENESVQDRYLQSFQFHILPGFSYRFTSGRVKASFRCQYEFNLLIPTPLAYTSSDEKYYFGQADLYQRISAGVEVQF